MKKSKLLDIAKNMPPLYHKFADEDFDLEKSEVIKWLIQQPDILKYVLQRISGGNGFIVYDPDTGTWRGVDYHGD